MMASLLIFYAEEEHVNLLAQKSEEATEGMGGGGDEAERSEADGAFVYI